MILVDTSVWIDHLRTKELALAQLLEAGQVITHPFIIGEIALGKLQQRDTILNALHDLPQAHMAGNSEVLDFIARHHLAGTGIGYVDAHILAALRLTSGASLFTRDKRLLAVSNQLGLTAMIS